MYMADAIRIMNSCTIKPIVFNEDAHFDFDKDMNNIVAAVSKYASWGYFGLRADDEGFESGFQSAGRLID